jgi:hypothetical protein
LLITTLFTTVCLGKIRHLEIGAANYSAKGGNAKERFLILEKTAKNLIASYGAIGTIYLNDIDESGLEMAKTHLSAHLLNRGYSKIDVVAILGDYTEIDLPFIKTAHMKNPDYTQLPTGPDKDINSTTNKKVLSALDKIALKSETGLFITSEYEILLRPENWPLRNSDFVPTGRIGLAYYAANHKDGDGYMDAPKEYHIKPKNGCFATIHKFPGT